MTDKTDFKKTDKAFYTGKVGRWDAVELPEMSFLMIDGQGAPGGPAYARALGALYPVAYGVKFAQKSQGADFVVPPLEALWWADDPSVFVRDDRAAWQWTAMLRLPLSVTPQDVVTIQASAAVRMAKKGGDPEAIAELRLQKRCEGVCLQTLHVGPYSEEAPVLAELHDRVMPAAGLTFNGAHHEIYLGDPRRVAPEKLRTILRQPVAPV